MRSSRTIALARSRNIPRENHPRRPMRRSLQLVEPDAGRGLADARDERPVLLAIGFAGSGLGPGGRGRRPDVVFSVCIADRVRMHSGRFPHRRGVLILLMPMSGSSTLFPHEMFGVVGLNPLNLLLAGTLISCMLHALADHSLPRLLPGPVLWLYIVRS